MKLVKVYGTRPKNHPFPLISWLIRLFEWSKMSHVAIYFSEHEDVFGTHFNKIEFVLNEEYTQKHRVVYEVSIPFTNSEYDKLREMCESYPDKQKGYWVTLFGTFIPLMMRSLFNKIIKHPCPRGYTCSWFLLKLFTDLGYEYKGPIDPPNFTTRDAIEYSVDLTLSMPKSRFNQLK